MEKSSAQLAALGVALAMLLLGACAGSHAPLQMGIGTEVSPSPLGEAIADLSPQDRQDFAKGLLIFKKDFTSTEGLGPVFNSTSCASCHAASAIGGATFEPAISTIVRIGRMDSGVYSDLVGVGGPIIQIRSLKDFDPAYPFFGEAIPSEAQFVSHRTTTPLFGAGLIEAIPGSLLIASANLPKPFGIKGRVNLVRNLSNGLFEVGRFGWKAQHANLESFTAIALSEEMGITTPMLPSEHLPQGIALPEGADPAPDPENRDDVRTLADFTRYLAPPNRVADTSETMRLGEQLFESTGCAVCHTPSLVTGESSNAALSRKIVRLYSDLLLHDMGPQLADGIIQGSAKGTEFRTAPLWGLSKRFFFLHDGRTRKISEAITTHGGEANEVTQRFLTLTADEQAAIVYFLKRL